MSKCVFKLRKICFISLYQALILVTTFMENENLLKLSVEFSLMKKTLCLTNRAHTYPIIGVNRRQRCDRQVLLCQTKRLRAGAD